MNKFFKKNERGFTLAELLIVVAIIAVLVAISIPIFTSQLENARESTDAANIRAAYAEVMADALTANTAGTTDNGCTVTMSNGAVATVSKDVTKVTQQQGGWQNTNIKDIAGIATDTATTDDTANKIPGKPTNGWTITYTADSGAVTITAKA